MMDTSKLSLPPLAEYVDVKDALAPLGVFPNVDSLRWFVRVNKDLLVECGALILVTGRHRIHIERTKKVIVQSGHQAAVSRISSCA
jgi:hypothetical protein